MTATLLQHKKQQISLANVGRSINSARIHIRSSRREVKSKEEEYGVHSV